MPESPEIILIIGAILILISVMVSKVSERLGIPLLLLFLLLGMVAGSEGLGGIYFDDPLVAQPGLYGSPLCYASLLGRH